MVGEIATSNFRLRNFRLTDAQSMFKNYCSSESVCKHLSWHAHTSIKETEILLEDRMIPSIESEHLLQLAITPKYNDNDVIGDIRVYFNDATAAIGFVIATQYQKLEIVCELMEAMIDFIKEIDEVESIYGYAEVDNLKSNHAFQHLKFNVVDTIYDKRKLDSCEDDVVECNLYEYKINA